MKDANVEIEAKFFPVNKDKLRIKLAKLKARLVSPERKMRRTIFDARFHPEFHCDYIRVRDEGDIVRLSAKTHASTKGAVNDQRETDVIVSDYDRTVQIFKLMNFTPDSYQESLRETWQLDDCEITIDTWPDLDPYCEIEAPSEKKLKEVAEKIGFDWNKKIITSVVEIIAQTFGLSFEQVHQKMERLRLDDHPFAGLTKSRIPQSQDDELS